MRAKKLTHAVLEQYYSSPNRFSVCVLSPFHPPTFSPASTSLEEEVQEYSSVSQHLGTYITWHLHHGDVSAALLPSTTWPSPCPHQTSPPLPPRHPPSSLFPWSSARKNCFARCSREARGGPFPNGVSRIRLGRSRQGLGGAGKPVSGLSRPAFSAGGQGASSPAALSIQQRGLRPRNSTTKYSCSCLNPVRSDRCSY